VAALAAAVRKLAFKVESSEALQILSENFPG
jgi:hypothetical protein